ncbi:MAG: OsmC family protein [Pseudomonadota bacterium]|nr:MAG: OsmC family protein [Pseudomonadota bacterium]
MLKQQPVTPDQYLNGLNVTEYGKIVEAVRDEPRLAKFQFRATNRWHGGGLNQTTIRNFHGGGEEQGVDSRHFTVDTGEPPLLLGDDEAPNPAEYLLHALAGCLTSTIVYKAAARGIKVESIESSIEGDMDAHNFLEISDAQRTGYQNIRARFRVKADASPETLRALAEFSPIYDTVVHGTSVSIDIERV